VSLQFRNLAFDSSFLILPSVLTRAYSAARSYVWNRLHSPCRIRRRNRKRRCLSALKPRILIFLLSYSMNSGQVLGCVGMSPLGGTQATADRLLL
jgi:hypothetical protein